MNIPITWMTFHAYGEEDDNRRRTVDDYVIDGDLAFSDMRSALKFYQEQYHKKKEWVGLTDAETEQIVDAYWNDPAMFIDAIEAKLKEKNHAA